LSRHAALVVVAASAVGMGAVLFAACATFSADGGGEDATAADGATVDSGPVADASLDVAQDRAAPPCDGGAESRACGDRFVFVTAGTLPGDFASAADTEASALADAFCQQEADRQTVHPALKGRAWRAWLCTASESAVGRAATTEARWILPGGEVAFPSLAAFRNGTPVTPLGGNFRVWTGCTATTFGLPGGGCNDWTTQTLEDGGPAEGSYGLANDPTFAWSASAVQPCSLRAPLYCFEYAP
jgi:hypothetical protein